jgi:Phospholipase_D-nuclease N-terminal
MLVAADYPFLDIMWTMFLFFALLSWLAVFIMVMLDNFRRTDHGGVAKAGWMLLMLFLPILGVLIYMVARSSQADALAV